MSHKVQRHLRTDRIVIHYQIDVIWVIASCDCGDNVLCNGRCNVLLLEPSTNASRGGLSLRPLFRRVRHCYLCYLQSDGSENRRKSETRTPDLVDDVEQGSGEEKTKNFRVHGLS